MIQISVQLTKAQRDSLMALGKASGTKAGDLIRQAVDELLTRAAANARSQNDRDGQASHHRPGGV